MIEKKPLTCLAMVPEIALLLIGVIDQWPGKQGQCALIQLVLVK